LKRLLRPYLPSVMRTEPRGYLVGLVRDAMDALTMRARHPLVPPNRLNSNGAGDYLSVGRNWRARFVEHGLEPHHSVLDVGCGTGRIAAALTDYLTPDARYLGLDVLRPSIEWAARAFKPFPHFAFRWVDVRNPYYNPKGLSAAHLPFESRAFDFSFMTSVFTHLHDDVAARYLKEVARALKPGGTFVASWYLVTNQTFSAPTRFSFQHNRGHYRLERSTDEAYAIAYADDWVLKQYDSAGLHVAKVLLGSWQANPGYAGQDVIVATKPCSDLGRG
jgi:SAM-dependent methyltransferase